VKLFTNPFEENWDAELKIFDLGDLSIGFSSAVLSYDLVPVDLVAHLGRALKISANPYSGRRGQKFSL